MKNPLTFRYPTPSELKNHKYLRWLGKHLRNSDLWAFNRQTASKAAAIGLFCAFLPVPFQMLLAAPSAVFFRANLPLSVALVWITNPLTMPPIFYACYKLGALVLGVSLTKDFVMSSSYLWHTLGEIWQPFILGCLIISSASAAIGYLSVHLYYICKPNAPR